jgi:hypothetical protein
MKVSKEELVDIILRLDPKYPKYDLERMSRNELKQVSFKLKGRW